MRSLFSLILAATLLAACPAEPESSPPRVIGGTTGAPGTTGAHAATDTPTPHVEAPLAFVDGERRLMGTVFVIRTLAPRERAEPAIAAALDEIARLEQLLSEWIPTSEMSRINASAGGPGIVVGPETWSVVSTGLDISRRSEGAFDLSWAALRGLYDFHDQTPSTPDAAEIRRRLPLVKWQDVLLSDADRTIRLRRRGMAIGTGAIGKGFALDRASEVLRAAGIENFMIYGGGQVTLHGRRGDRLWRVGIQHPRENRLVASFEATDASVSTSGDYEHSFFDAAGVRIHHIVDPGTGLPARRSISVTIVTPDGMHADALSTAVFVLGADAGLEMLSHLDGNVKAAIIDANCVLHTTPGFREELRFETPLEAGDVVPGCRGVP